MAKRPPEAASAAGFETGSAEAIDARIKEDGYRLSPKSGFVAEAPQDLVGRAEKNSVGDGGYSWVLWDPLDGEDGFLVTGDELNVLWNEFVDRAAMSVATNGRAP